MELNRFEVPVVIEIARSSGLRSTNRSPSRISRTRLRYGLRSGRGGRSVMAVIQAADHRKLSASTAIAYGAVSTWINGAIAEAHYPAGAWSEARDAIDDAFHCDGAIGNAFLHMRLGQVELQLGQLDAVISGGHAAPGAHREVKHASGHVLCPQEDVGLVSVDALS